MGFIRNIVKSVDVSDDIAAEVKESLNILMTLAESKASGFQTTIEADLLTGRASDTLTVPITKVLQSKIEFRGVTKILGPGELVGEITKSLTSLFVGDGDLLTGISKVVENALTLLFGAGKGEEAEVRAYTVVAEYPAIVRYDFAFWCRNIEAENIYKQMQNALACVAYKSAVDVTKLDFNTFLAIYQPILVIAYGSNPEKLEDMITQAENIYKRFINMNSQTVAGVNPALSLNLAPARHSTSIQSFARTPEKQDASFAPFITYFKKS